MLNLRSQLLLILSIFTAFIILNGILTYNKEGKDNKKIVFYILLLLIYVIARLFNLEQIFSNKMLYIIVFIIWGIYYNYFYKIGYVRYTIFFFLFSVYYDLLVDVIYRNLFLVITGNVLSSKEALLVYNFYDFKVNIYTQLSIIFIYIFIYILSKELNNRFELFSSDKKNYIYLILALIVNFINIIVIYTSKKLERFGWGYSELYVVGYIVTPRLILASSIVIILLFLKIIKENKMKSQNELIKNKLDMQYAYYLSIQESHMKVKKLYHDINNHICCIDNLKNNNSEINEYVKNLKDEIKEFKVIYNTGNMILDIIINENSERCIKKGIKFICDINFSKVNFIKPIDVSSIFANILDNAIEACDKIYDENIDKYIRIKGTISKSYFVLKCENSKVNNIRVNKNRLLTDKMDKFMHGIGIQSIKSSLQKYNGELLFEEDKERFTLNIYIPLNQNTDSWVD